MQENTHEMDLWASLEKNAVLCEILRRVGDLGLPNWYLGAGCIAQTHWNVVHEYPADAHILDYDLVYFDAGDTSKERETAYARAAKMLCADLPAVIDVVNEARVHIWFPEHFGFSIPPYKSVEHAISTWPTTATAIGVRQEKGERSVFSPFGLSDLLFLRVRANKGLITKDIYRAKAERWKAAWPNLSVAAWEE